jgi:serine protease Do
VYIKAGSSSGSGFIINSTGSIITNAHVVKDMDTVNIKLSDGRSFIGSVVGRDKGKDIALINIYINGLEYIQLGDSSSSKLKQGDRVIAFGYPFGLDGEVSIKEGTISRRLYDGDTTYLETSAEIHPGNSGGPLVNSRGDVVGMNVAILGEAINGVLIGETIKLAIPINVVKNLIPTL